MVAEIIGEAEALGWSDRFEGVKVVTPRDGLGVAEQLAITATHQSAGFGDQPKRVPTFIRTFPSCTSKRAMVREYEAEGEVTRRCTRIKPVVDFEQLDKPNAPIGGRRG